MRETLRKVVMAVLMTPAATMLPLAAESRGLDEAPFGRLGARRAAVASATRAASLPGGEEISEENYDKFDLGFALVRAAYFSRVAADDEEFSSDAIIELVYLADRLEGQPEAAKLQAVLKSVVRGTGAADERWDAVAEVIKSYSARQQPTARWFFDSGVALTKVALYSYLEDQPGLQAELKSLQQLVARTPRGVPSEVITPMREVAEYAAEQSLTSNDYEKIAETAGEAMESVLG